jgi:chitinase
MLKHIVTLALFAPGLLAAPAFAYDCTGIAPHQEKATYAAGEDVQAQGTAYRCTESGWCSQGGPYAPGDGWAWKQAWQALGSCDKGTASNASDAPRPRVSSSHLVSPQDTCSDVRPWNQAEAYNGGIRAQHNGHIYEARWWTQGDEPTQDSDGWQTWQLVGSCGHSDSTS